jgi:putative addiction module component (TIGR02574 family)
MSSESVIKEARALPLAERIELCRNLLEEIGASKELTPGEAALIDSRLRDHLNHPDDVVSLEEVRAKLDAKYGKFDSMSAEEIVEQIRRLPEGERREVIERIANEFVEYDDELTPEQIAELDWRAEEALAHLERCRPLEDVMAVVIPPNCAVG